MAATPPKPSIRELLLNEIIIQTQQRDRGSGFYQNNVLNQIFIKHRGIDEEAVLTQWSELFRTGLIAWGLNFSNPDPPWFHLTERGRTALSNVTRDPSNPSGYLRHLSKMASINPIASSYLTEALECYVAGLFKASAVMTGGAAEAMLNQLRDEVVAYLGARGESVPKQMTDWRTKTVADSLFKFFDGKKATFDRGLMESFEDYWPAFTAQIRTVRNDAGHPASIDPVTADTVHAALLIFPEFARLLTRLGAWLHNSATTVAP